MRACWSLGMVWPSVLLVALFAAAAAVGAGVSTPEQAYSANYLGVAFDGHQLRAIEVTGSSGCEGFAPIQISCQTGPFQYGGWHFIHGLYFPPCLESTPASKSVTTCYAGTLVSEVEDTGGYSQRIECNIITTPLRTSHLPTCETVGIWATDGPEIVHRCNSYMLHNVDLGVPLIPGGAGAWGCFP